MDSTKAYVKTMFNAQAIGTVAGATSTTTILHLNTTNPEGYFSIVATTTSAGAAVLKLQYSISHDGTNFYIPENKAGTVVDDIVTAHAVGTKSYTWAPVSAPYYKLVATITAADATAVTVTVGIK